jgi:16S rRNA (guanine527-N7)-methyltransferase
MEDNAMDPITTKDNGMKQILKYFPTLTESQKEQLGMLDALYRDWNAKINVISRKDIDNLYEHHVLHSMGIAKLIRFRPGTEIMDLGTGGGFPGIPLAILFPEVHFDLVDSIGKKMKVCSAVAEALGLKNVNVRHIRGEEIKDRYDFVVCRAVMPIMDTVKAVHRNIKSEQHNSLPNGLLCLKGGELQQEILPIRHRATLFDLNDYFSEEFFETKKIVHVSI